MLLSGDEDAKGVMTRWTAIKEAISELRGKVRDGSTFSTFSQAYREYSFLRPPTSPQKSTVKNVDFYINIFNSVLESTETVTPPPSVRFVHL